MDFFKTNSFRNFEQFEDALKGIQDTTEKGNIFEIFGKYFFEFYKERYRIKNIWIPDTEIPNSKKQQLGISERDKGADGLLENIEGEFYVFQAKFRSDRTSATYNELTNAYFQSQNCSGMYIFSNSTHIPREFRENDLVFPILINDLIDLPKEFFDWLYEISNNTEYQHQRHQPKSYQSRAIDSIVGYFEAHNSARGQYIAACGSGKTLTSLWIKEKLDANKTLFLVPSIYLIKQTLNQWLNQRSNNFVFCCVCSGNDQDLDINDPDEDERDYVDIDPNELGVKVTTNKEELKSFLSDNEKNNIVIFSTYHSSSVVSDAIQSVDQKFDLMICDEAHKTAGVEGVFSKVLEDDFIPSKKRLFLTATPRILSSNAIKSAEEVKFNYSTMDDEDKYGPVLDTFSFREAIREEAIVNYEILIMGIEESHSEEFRRLHNISELDGRPIQNKDIAVAIATEKLFKDREYDIDKAINFSSTISRAENFSKCLELEEIDSQVFGYSNSISSKQNPAIRKGIMNEFISSNKAILSNARCLTEGVDVPGVDAVIFSDRKSSLIDIVQATGRALRKNINKPDKIAKIFIPIFMAKDGETKDINKYLYLYEIIESLKMHDEGLKAVIDNLHAEHVGISTGNNPTTIKFLAFNNANIEELKKILVPQIAKINGEAIKELKIKYTGLTTSKPKVDYRLPDRHYIHKDHVEKITRENLNLFSEEYVDYQKKPDINMPRPEYVSYLGNNFASHTERYELMERRTVEGTTQMRLTESGKRFVDGEELSEILRELFERKDDLKNYPFIAVREILNSVKQIDDLSFLYGVYLMSKDDPCRISNAIERINSIKEKNLNFNEIKQNLESTFRVIELLNEEHEEALELFEFKRYDPENHIYLGGMKDELPYLANFLTICWPDHYHYDKKARILSVK